MDHSIKLIVTDLDGTLLRSDKTLTDYTLSVWDRCKQRGILTAVATARFEIGCQNYTERLRPDILITADGALARRGEQIIYRDAISPETATRFIDELRGEGITDVVVGTEEGCLWNSREIYLSPVLHEAVYDDFTEPLDSEVFKILVNHSGDDTAIRTIALRYPELGLITYAGENRCALVDRLVTKEGAIRGVARVLGIDMEAIVAFGDDERDRGMLEVCGTGVAVANAKSAIKKAADFTCGPNDQDGVAHWITENLLA